MSHTQTCHNVFQLVSNFPNVSHRGRQSVLDDTKQTLNQMSHSLQHCSLQNTSSRGSNWGFLLVGDRGPDPLATTSGDFYGCLQVSTPSDLVARNYVTAPQPCGHVCRLCRGHLHIHLP